jgi:double-stranded uracil-DNA glycosylase
MAALVGFAPIGSGEPRILILGSFPSVASLERGEYYGHERNQFWAILGSILGFAADAPYGERAAALGRSGIALWDVLASCEREGSLDQDIRAELANPIAEFIAGRPSIGRLALNGGKAFSSFAAQFAPELGKAGIAIGQRAEWRPPSAPDRRILVARLPSTSPVPTRDYRRALDKLPAWSSFLEI